MKMSLTNVNNGDNDGEPVMKTTVLDSDRHHKTRHKHHVGCTKVVDADLHKYKIQDKEIQKYSILLMRFHLFGAQDSSQRQKHKWKEWCDRERETFRDPEYGHH